MRLGSTKTLPLMSKFKNHLSWNLSILMWSFASNFCLDQTKMLDSVSWLFAWYWLLWGYIYPSGGIEGMSCGNQDYCRRMGTTLVNQKNIVWCKILVLHKVSPKSLTHTMNLAQTVTWLLQVQLSLHVNSRHICLSLFPSL